jgi:hypothetical protein
MRVWHTKRAAPPIPFANFPGKTAKEFLKNDDFALLG